MTTDAKPEVTWRRLQVFARPNRGEVVYGTWDQEGRCLYFNSERSAALDNYKDNPILVLDLTQQQELRDGLVEMMLGGEDNPVFCWSCRTDIDVQKGLHCNKCHEEACDG